MFRKTVLDNGIRVLSETIPTAHSVSVGVWVANGSRHELAHENGISHFIEHMLFKGTSRRSAQQIAREVDQAGGLLNAFTSREYSCYYVKVLARRLPLAIDLLGDVVLNPLLDLDEIEKERRVILQEINMVEDAADDLIHDLFNKTFWKKHSLGFSILGSAVTVGAFDRNALITFLQQRYRPHQLVITAAGHLDHDRLVEQLITVFGDLNGIWSGPIQSPPDYGSGIDVTQKSLEQVHFCLGTRALPQNHPNRFAAYVLNALLGGSMSSRLFQAIREDRGLAYSIYSFLHCHSDGGALVVYAGTAPEDARQVVDLVLKEMHRLSRAMVDEPELTAAREQLRGNLLLSLESTENRMTRLAKNEFYLGRHLSVKDVLAAFDQVDAEDVRRLAESLFQDDFLNLHLLGPVDPGEFPVLDLTLG